jgi:integrase
MIRYGDVRKMRWRGRKESTRWYARVYKYDISGKPVGKSWKCTGHTQRDLAEAQVHAWRRTAIECSGLVDGEPQLLGDALVRWIAERTLGRSKHYVRMLRTAAKQWTARWSKRLVASISRTDIAMYIAERHKAGIAAITENKDCGLMRMFWRWAILHKLTRESPVPDRNPLPMPAPTVRAISEAEEARLLAAAATISEAAYGYVLLLLCTGFRGALADSVRWEHVDLAESMWHIPSELLKSRHPYSQPICERLLVWLRAHRKTSGKIFGPGPRYTWYAIREIAGLRGLKRHDLRRTFVTRCRKAGIKMEVTMELSDHRDVRTMLRFYRAVDVTETRDALASVFGR